MNRNSLIILSLVLALFGNETYAQLSLSGIVIDSTSGAAIAGVEIFDDVSKQVTTTGVDGSYSFIDLPMGLHTFTLFSMDYNTISHDLDLKTDFSYDFKIEPLKINLTAVEISAKREELFEIKRLADVVGTSIFAGKKTEVVVLDLVKGNLATNNGRQVYAQVAGLNIYEGSDGGLQLNLGGRGLDPNRTSNFNTRQNGYDISADVLGYPENYYTPPSESLSEIRIIRGASSLQYGTQFGGLIDFRTRKIRPSKKVEVQTKQTLGSFGLFNSFNYLGVNTGSLSVNSFYNYKRGDGYRDNSEFDSHNFFFNADYKLGKQTKIGFEFTHFNYLAKQAGGLTDEQFAFDPRLSTRSRNWFKVNWNLFNLTLNHKFSKMTDLSVNLFALDAYRYSVGYRGNPIDLNQNPITTLDEQNQDEEFVNPRDLILGSFKNSGAELRLIHNYEIGERKAVFLIGSKYYKSNNTSMQGPGSRGVDADFTLQTNEFTDYSSQSDFKFPNLNFSLFSENIFYLNDKLTLVPGFRLEHITTRSDGVYNQVVFDNAGNAISNKELSEAKDLKRRFALFGLGLNYKKSQTMNFVANLSQNYRSITFSDIRIVSPSFIVDPNIRDERGITLDFGVKGRVQKVLSYDVTVFSVLYNDRIGIILDDRANRVRKNIGRALITGVESLVNFNIGRMLTPDERNYSLSYFVNTAYTYSEYLESEENNVEGKQVEFIPKLNIKTGISGGFKNVKASLQLTYLSDQFTDVQNSRIAEPGDNRSGIIGEIPAYQIMDFTLSYNLRRLKFEGGINNLLDHNYFTRRATGYPGPGIIPSEGRAFYLTVSYNL